MKAVFINAEKRTVEDIEINFKGDCGLDEFYETIGHGCDIVQHVYLDALAPEKKTGDVLVVDEESFSRPITFGFIIRDFQVIGNGIIVGSGKEDFCDAKLTAKDIEPMIDEFFTLLS